MKYPFIVAWSEQDGQYIALCPNFPTLSGFGATPAKAIAQGEQALALFVAQSEKEGIEVQEPLVIRGPVHAKKVLERLVSAKSMKQETTGTEHTVAEPAASYGYDGIRLESLGGLADMYYLIELKDEPVVEVHLPPEAEADIARWNDQPPSHHWWAEAFYDQKDNKVLLVGKYGSKVHGIWRERGV